MSRFFIDRPIFAWVLSIVIVISGLACVASLPVAQYPPIVPPTIQVTVSYPGASAKTVSDAVGQPIEAQVNGVEGMIYMSSTCTNNGQYALTVSFEVGTDIHTALMLVQTRVQLALPQLPESVQKQGVNVKMQSPNILLAVNMISPAGRYDPLYLSNYAQINIFDELSRVPGVGLVNFLGQRQYSMRAWLDPQKLASLDLTASEVIDAISEQNVVVAAGNIGQQPVPPGQNYQLVLNTLGRLSTPKQFGEIIVKVGQDGRYVRLRDVAKIDLGSQNSDLNCTLTTFVDGKAKKYPSVALAVFALPTANALAVGEGVKHRMEELKHSFPDGVDYRIAYDTTPFIEHSVHDVFITIYIAAGLVIVVVLVFLQDWRAMLLPIIDIVVALIGTFVVMAGLGFSLNNLSLFGLVLAVGIVVDDSIVVVENIERWMGQGLPARGDDQSDGGDHRPGHRHHVGVDGGLHSDRVYPGSHGPILPAIRAHDCRGRVLFGDQRPHNGARAGGRLDQASWRRSRCERSVAARRCRRVIWRGDVLSAQPAGRQCARRMA